MLGVIVDGPGDYASFAQKFRGVVKVLKADGPRGHTVKPCEIIGAALKQIDMLSHLGCGAIAIVTDLEKRSGGYTGFIRELEKEVNAHTFSIPVCVSAPNQMIENWYLADIEKLSSSKVYIRDNLKQKNYEGLDGKAELKKLFKSRFDYKETKHGPELFKIVRVSVARKNSSSFDCFMNILNMYKNK